MAPHSSTLVWKIPWAEEPGGLVGCSPGGHQESDTPEATQQQQQQQQRVSHPQSRCQFPPLCNARVGPQLVFQLCSIEHQLSGTLRTHKDQNSESLTPTTAPHCNCFLHFIGVLLEITFERICNIVSQLYFKKEKRKERINVTAKKGSQTSLLESSLIPEQYLHYQISPLRVTHKFILSSLPLPLGLSSRWAHSVCWPWGSSPATVCTS